MRKLVLSFTSLIFSLPSMLADTPSYNRFGYEECGEEVVHRIVGGHSVEPHSQPWMAHFLFQNQYGCGGALITKRHVLSAAHCNHDYTHVLLGDHNMSRPDVGERRYKIKKWYDHPKAWPVTKDGPTIRDFAIAELDTDVDINKYVNTVCLPSKTLDFVGKKAIVSGWGRLQHKGESPDVLMTVNVTVRQPERCNAAWWMAWGSRYGIPYNNDVLLCANEFKKDSCQGDSGGPLVYEEVKYVNGGTQIKRRYVIGIVSFGRGCARPNHPGFYARVSGALDWINSIIAPYQRGEA